MCAVYGLLGRLAMCWELFIAHGVRLVSLLMRNRKKKDLLDKYRCYLRRTPENNVKLLLSGDLPSLNRLANSNNKTLFDSKKSECEREGDAKQKAERAAKLWQQKQYNAVLQSVPTLGISFLCNLPSTTVVILAKLSQFQRKQILEKLRPLEFEAGEYIITQGDKGDDFFIVVEGIVSVTVGFVHTLILLLNQYKG